MRLMVTKIKLCYAIVVSGTQTAGNYLNKITYIGHTNLLKYEKKYFFPFYHYFSYYYYLI